MYAKYIVLNLVGAYLEAGSLYNIIVWSSCITQPCQGKLLAKKFWMLLLSSWVHDRIHTGSVWHFESHSNYDMARWYEGSPILPKEIMQCAWFYIADVMQIRRQQCILLHFVRIILSVDQSVYKEGSHNNNNILSCNLNII